MALKNKRKKRFKAPALNKEVIKLIKADDQLIADIILASKRSYPTVMRWFDENSEMLTTVKVLNVICMKLNMTESQVLYSPKPVALADND